VVAVKLRGCRTCDSASLPVLAKRMRRMAEVPKSNIKQEENIKLNSPEETGVA
jgi:hypothetical protein